MTICKRTFILVALVGILLAKEVRPLDAKDSDNDYTNLNLKADAVTEVEFPTNIANVTKSVPSVLLQIETLGNRMFLLARENFNSSIYVITADNVSYCLHLIVGEEKASSSRIKIEKPHEDAIVPKNRKKTNTIKLMKSLINGELLRDAESLNERNREVFNNDAFRIIVDEVYELESGTKAFVLSFENLTSRPMVIPIEHREIPGLLAISTDRQILEARPHDTSKKNKNFTAKAYMIIEGLK